jgi:hypothetical protein
MARRERIETDPNQFVEPGGFVHALSSNRYEKSPVRGSAEFNRFVKRDMFVPSLGLTLRASRCGPACGCPNSFRTLRRQDAAANIAIGDGPKGEDRD